jgi:hypothetical protein
LAVAGVAQSSHGGVKQCRSVPSPLRLINNEERPDIACLMVYTGKALNSGLILRNEEDRLVHIPSDFFIGDDSGID